MLNGIRTSGQVDEVIQLNSLVGGGTVLILGRFRTNPEEDVVLKLLGIGVGDDGLQDDVRITGKEFAVLLLGPGLNLKFLNTPDPHTLAFTHSLPGLFGLGCLQALVLILFGADLLDIRVFNIELLCLLHSDVYGTNRNLSKKTNLPAYLLEFAVTNQSLE
eukprot:Lithocolla_globosa_v1_NODE_1768_length_2349_cov_6183.342633.p3 type:complete len:161 gc:universal NODE_1768_length_2349_cov_6183.342633:1601-1119(-)